MTTYTPLRMIAKDGEDLHILAACLQDALVPVSGLEYDKEGGFFHLVANRFCWECDENDRAEPLAHSRVMTGLAFHHVKEVQKKGLDLHNKNELVNLLTIHNAEDEGCIHIIFSGGSEIKLTVERLSCHLKDVDEPYPTPNRPVHGVKQE